MLQAQTIIGYTENLFVTECLFLGLIILAVRQRGDLSTLILSATFLWVVARSLVSGIVDEALLTQYPRLYYLPQLQGFEIPIFYLYTRYLLQLPTSRRHWLVLLPSVLLFLAYSVAFVLGIEQVPFLKSILNYQNTLLEVGQAGYDLLLFALAFRIIYQQEHRLQQYLSDLQAVRLNWLKAFFIAVLLVSTYETTRYFLHHFRGINVEENLWTSIIPLLIYSFFFFIITYYGLKYPVILRSVLAPEPGPAPAPALEESTRPRYEKSKLPGTRAQELYGQIITYLESEAEPYREPELRLSELAAQLNQATAYLSQAIGQCSPHGNFYNLVNHYRVEAVKHRLRQPGSDRLTLLGIAQECGFTNNQTFGKAFKQATGMTPSQYRVQHRSEQENAAQAPQKASILIRPDANGVD
ncbi:helix-turn-helix domain-containing protein [Hymenobacter terrenus]|uniref:helix-turn-helix domain-containing protein n=1 Tax=Hymenobacter terrenus TaxID=1629124 RepID=UPI000619EFF1|nr:AraC family transcriptional regulator [Hymenobacter terrenus]